MTPKGISLSIASEPIYVETKEFCEPQILYIVGCIIGSRNSFKLFPESLFF